MVWELESQQLKNYPVHYVSLLPGNVTAGTAPQGSQSSLGQEWKCSHSPASSAISGRLATPTAPASELAVPEAAALLLLPCYQCRVGFFLGPPAPDIRSAPKEQVSNRHLEGVMQGHKHH